MAELKTKPSDFSVEAFLNNIHDPLQREDSRQLVKMMSASTKSEPKMWGSNIIGFGKGSYSTADGKQHEWFQIGFSPRSGKLSLYVMSNREAYEDLLAKLGKHATGKGCLYIKHLTDVNEKVLKQIVDRAAQAAAV